MNVLTACTLDCPDSCSLIVTREAGGAIHVRGNPDHPFTAGFTCRKARTFAERLQSRQRITTPQRRTATGWQPVSWDQALDLCAEKIDEYRKEPVSILHFHGEGAKGVLKQASKLFFAMLGSTQVKGSLCDAAGYLAFVADFGSRQNNDFTDILHARRIVNWGKDLMRSSVHMASMVRKARQKGARVLTVSPGGDGSEAFSDDFVRIKPGTDRFLACAALRRILDEGAVRKTVLPSTHGWKAFRDLVMTQSPEVLGVACGVDKEGVERVVSYYRQEEPTATIVGTGLQRYAFGGENTRFINALAMVTGHIGRSGGGSYYHSHSLRHFNLDWTKDPENKPRRTLFMPLIGQGIREAEAPPIRMIWVDGSNVVNQAPDALETARAFEAIPFKVVVDAFMTDTAERADLVLPCALLLEQDDIEGSYLHSFVHIVRKAFDPPGEARTDYWILSELGRRLSPPVILPLPDDIFRASLRSPSLDLSLEELRERGYVRANEPKVAYEGLKFAHGDGKYRFPEALHEEPPPPEGFPLRLLTLIRGEAIHSQIAPENQTVPPTAWVGSECTALGDGGLEEGDEVFLVAPNGARLRVRLEILPGVHPEVVVYRRGDWMKLGGGANQLIKAGLTDIGRGAPYYQQYVRVERIPPQVDSKEIHIF